MTKLEQKLIELGYKETPYGSWLKYHNNALKNFKPATLLCDEKPKHEMKCSNAVRKLPYFKIKRLKECEEQC